MKAQQPNTEWIDFSDYGRSRRSYDNGDTAGTNLIDVRGDGGRLTVLCAWTYNRANGVTYHGVDIVTFNAQKVCDRLQLAFHPVEVEVEPDPEHYRPTAADTP